MITRESLLEQAKRTVCGERQDQYGKPESSFQTIADYWTVYLKTPVYPVDVACMMILLKVARSGSDPEHLDNFTDIAGYAACGAEVQSAAMKILLDEE